MVSTADLGLAGPGHLAQSGDQALPCYFQLIFLGKVAIPISILQCENRMGKFSGRLSGAGLCAHGLVWDSGGMRGAEDRCGPPCPYRVLFLSTGTEAG